MVSGQLTGWMKEIAAAQPFLSARQMCVKVRRGAAERCPPTGEAALPRALALAALTWGIGPKQRT
jgi:hypothetical protein